MILFSTGPCSVTPSVLEFMTNLGFDSESADELIRPLLIRHVTGDFGTAGKYSDILPTITVDERNRGVLATRDDGKINALAVQAKEGRVMSYYTLKDIIDQEANNQTPIWVCTYLGPNGYTVVMLPTDYEFKVNKKGNTYLNFY